MRALPRPAGTLAAVVLSAALLTACMSMPVAGPVETAGDVADTRADVAADIVAAPPRPGESATDIVVHFLDAMTASPISTSVAKEFLTRNAAAAWDPGLETITYRPPVAVLPAVSESGPLSGTQLTVTLPSASYLDARGTWQGQLPDERSVVTFPMEREAGEWRIAAAPNALIVPESWFQQRFRQVSLYFFDRRGEVLVPEPVYLPSGEQLPTALTRALLLGPPDGLAGADRTFFPEGMTSLPLPVTQAGVAEVPLEGDLAQLTPESTQRMLSQLAWTLRQVAGISSLRVSVGDQPVRLASGTDEIPVELGAEFDPTGILASADLFAVREGVLVTGPIDDLAPVEGPFGQGDEAVPLRWVAVDPTSTTVAGVSERGRTVLVGPLYTVPSASVDAVVSGGQDLLKPSWDAAGRLWLVDRRDTGAVVSVVVGRRQRAVQVAGVSGERVKAFLVSRDGTRFVAVVRGRSGDRLVVSRIGRQRGRVKVVPARELPWDVQASPRVLDIGWRTPTTIAVLYPLTEGLAQVRTVALDGSTGGSGQAPAVPLRGRWRHLVSSPVEDESLYAVSVSPSRVVDASGIEHSANLEGVRLSTLTYAG